MSLIFEQYLTEGIAQLSYLVGDTSTGVAVVIDPRPDVEIYLERARENALTITHIFETHVHADFMSGARELADRLGGAAHIYLSEESDPDYGFDHRPVKDGDTFEFGKTVLTARFTPGHTPEHLSYLLAMKDHPDSPWGILSGDSLFVDSVGRPDLLGEEETEQLAKQLFSTMQDFYLKLEDHVIVYPCHGAGSGCGPDIGDRTSTTVGYERRFNPYLRHNNVEDFENYLLSGSPAEPTHYSRLKKLNTSGPEILGGLPRIPGLTPEQFREKAAEENVTLVDTRSMLSFGGGHIKGALNIPYRPELSPWAGWVLDPEKSILLILEEDRLLDRALRYIYRVGFTKFAGYLVGDMTAWDEAGLPLQRLPQVDVKELKENGDGLQLLDVREQSEWEGGYIPGAKHHFVGQMLNKTPDLDRDKPVATYCGTGYRASIAASILQARGFKDVRNIPGSWTAWTNRDYPVENGRS